MEKKISNALNHNSFKHNARFYNELETRNGGVTTMAAILDFSQTGKTGHEQSCFGQQPCHCRLAEKPFHFRF